MRVWSTLGLVLLLSACASTPKVPVAGGEQRPRSDRVSGTSPTARVAEMPVACLQTREHRDEDYTPGGLYAPGVRDSAPTAPLDISGLVEPEPREEPRAAYGNRSPYTVLGKSYRVRDSARGYRERGVASWYGQKFHGRLTSSRELYDMCAFSAAHKTLPLPSFARVTNLDNGRSVVVRVNDRGPFHEGRIIDLSYAAAIKLGVDRTGTAKVEVEALAGGEFRYVQPMPEAPARAPMTTLDSQALRVLQVASFGEQGNAWRAAERLKVAGIEGVDVQTVEIDGRTLWRVRIGPVAAEAANALLRELRSLGFPGSRVFSE